jgi:hypothetical protein
MKGGAGRWKRSLRGAIGSLSTQAFEKDRKYRMKPLGFSFHPLGFSSRRLGRRFPAGLADASASLDFISPEVNRSSRLATAAGAQVNPR